MQIYIDKIVHYHIFQVLFLLFDSQNFLPLSKHVHVHGREEGDVGQHDDQDDQREAKGGIEHIGQMNREDILFQGLNKGNIGADQLTRDSNGIGNDEKCVSR